MCFVDNIFFFFNFLIQVIQNPSFVLESVQKVKFEDRPIPKLQDPHDVLVRVKFTGICGSDVSSPTSHSV